MTAAPRPRLVPWAIFAALIAAAGLPIYIHAPKFYVDEYGVSLASLGLVLFGLRLVDVLQDPALGWLAERTKTRRRPMVAAAAALMTLSMLGLFAITPPTAPLIWFALTLAGVFSAFSFLTICFYAQGVEKAAGLEVARLGMGNPGAGSPGGSGHLRLAGWREAGALIGISLAAVAPSVLAAVTLRPFAAFALGFAALALLATLAMRMEWTARGHVLAAAPFSAIGDPMARRLLLLAMVNAAPVAVTSSLFLFFVESRLQAPGLEGPLLLLFFATAAVAAPIWSRLAARFGAKRVLMAGMGLAVLAFGFA
ncbi:MAG: MFS transporter, partial [Paracoccaceae bacterium]|nr:MFS transporter [Paracoccaceae bacterium]